MKLLIPFTMSSDKQFCDPCIFLASRVSVMVLAVLQGGVLDYYLVHYNSHSWYFWIASDVAVIFSFLVAFFISYKELKVIYQSSKIPKNQVDAGSFPLSYFAWLVYSVILTVRVGVIFKNFAYRIHSGVFFGSNMLKFTIAIAGIIFLLIVSAHHKAQLGSPARHVITGLIIMVPFDIMDAVDILSIFFNEESKNSLEPILEWIIIIVACTNFVLPTLTLMVLSGSHFGIHPIPPMMKSLHRLLQIAAINAPLLSLRILLWHKQGEEVSVFMVKNIVCIMMVAMDIYETAGIKRQEFLPESPEDHPHEYRRQESYLVGHTL